MRVAIQGQEGSFHYSAAKQFFKNDNIDFIDCEEFEGVFETLQQDGVDYAVVAIENSLFGSINEACALLHQFQPWIIGEVYLTVNMHLLAKPGVELSDIRTVYSQAPALAQCRDYLKQNLPKAKIQKWHDTAASAAHVAELKSNFAAAIASEAAGKLNGLVSVAKHIEDNEHNYTRFLVLSNKRTVVEGANKTTAVMTTSHVPGALYSALSVFADLGINLDWLESRPIPGPDRRYMFYIDFESSASDELTTEATTSLEKQGVSLTILGTYVKSQPDNF